MDVVANPGNETTHTASAARTISHRQAHPPSSYENGIEPRRVHEVHGVAGPGPATQVAPWGHGADEDIGAVACACMRTRSPRMAPPENALEGSRHHPPRAPAAAPCAIMRSTRWTCPRPESGDATMVAPPSGQSTRAGHPWLAASSSATDGARQGPHVPGHQAIDELHGAYSVRRSSRAITRRWISLVPSPIVHSLTSR